MKKEDSIPETAAENGTSEPESVEKEASGRVERVGVFPEDELHGLFSRILPGKDQILLVYAKDGNIVCDRTDAAYLAERNRRRADAAFKKGVTVGKGEISRSKYHEGYSAGYREASEGMPYRDPNLLDPGESLTNCDFKCALCVYACPSCGHCTFYDHGGKVAFAEEENTPAPKHKPDRSGNRKKKNKEETEERNG